MNSTRASHRLTVKRWIREQLEKSLVTRGFSLPPTHYPLNERFVGIMKKVTVTPGVIVERVGDDLMVIVPGNLDVVSLSGRPAEVLLEVQEGRDVDPSEPALKALSDLGIVSSPGMSRRGLIKVGAIGAGAGIAVMAMPSVAVASSDPIPLVLIREFDAFLVVVPGWDGTNPSSTTTTIISAFVWVNGVAQGDKKADWEVYGSSFLAPGYALILTYNNIPANITEVRFTFEFDGETYVAVYTASV
jgi:hypothetical protein